MNNRLKQHAVAVRNGRFDNPEKCRRIQDIHLAGHDVGEVIFATYKDAGDALRAERTLILNFRSTTTNMVCGSIPEWVRAAINAGYWLSRMRSFDVWLATPTQEQLRCANATAGGARHCYDEVVNEFKEIASLTKPWCNSIKGYSI